MSYSRSTQLKNVAYELGMEYAEEDTWGLHTMLKDFKLFSRGRRRGITNMLYRRDGMLQLDVRIFDYRYTIYRNNHARVFKQTVFYVQSKNLGLPQFLMKPENFFHKVGAWLGIEDIDFERYPKFSNQYLLKGDDEDYIRASFSDEVLQFFTIEKDWTMEGLNYYLVLYRKNQLLLPSQIINFYKKGMQLHQLLRAEGLG
ncbi:MAG: hypothetical protein H6573_03375 [Lewinellaceae bacterium]|nr:hypothetical protein [Phaeodactylibacter sp.]MCB9346536.1 hypothetical protein [Lewinellaceae bacterium]